MVEGGVLRVHVNLAKDKADWGDPMAHALVFITDTKAHITLDDPKLEDRKTELQEKVQVTPIQFEDVDTAVKFDTFLPAGEQWHLSIFLSQKDGNTNIYHRVAHEHGPFKPQQVTPQTWSLQQINTGGTNVEAQLVDLSGFVELGDRQGCNGMGKPNNAAVDYVTIKGKGGSGIPEYDGLTNPNRTYKTEQHLTHPSQCIQYIGSRSEALKAIEWRPSAVPGSTGECRMWFDLKHLHTNVVQSIANTQNAPTSYRCYLKQNVYEEKMGEPTNPPTTNTTKPSYTHFPNFKPTVPTYTRPIFKPTAPAYTRPVFTPTAPSFTRFDK